MSHTDDRLAAIRARIDEIDDQLLELFSERARCAEEIARIKRAQEGDPVFYRPEREAQILRRIRERNPGPLSDAEVTRLIREVMSACLAHEQPLTVAYLGPEGTFTEAAAYKHFGHSIRTRKLDAIDEVFREVEAGSAHYGVVPVENSTEGVVNHTLDMFMRSPLKICGEVELRIALHLLGRVGSLQEVRRVYAHAQALAQSREWLDANLPHAERVPVSSNGEAARRAAEEAGTAAIASETAAEHYGLARIARDIEDEPGNTTRFLVIGNQEAGPSGVDKTSLLVSVRNRPGALYGLLSPFARHGISMTRIESRPSRRGVWDYVFFIDIEGHVSEAPVAAALAELDEQASLLRVLGSYPRCSGAS
ncbi:MAG: prephenate dehydratase [Gammaproteobacteria bacterium]|nr:MAG: prephenate dehydratase [Gammaproteobacteria bacterium]